MTTTLAMWSIEGLEYLFDVDQYQKDVAWATLGGKARPAAPPALEILKLRANANTDREYEIYAFNRGEFTPDEIREMFEDEDQCQALVDWIRENGEQLHSNKKQLKKKKIT